MVEPQSRSSNHSTTPPKSPLKPLPTAPRTSTRSSSQQHSRHSSSRSLSGQQHEPNSQPKQLHPRPRRASREMEPSSPRLERAMSAKRVEPILRDTASESSKAAKSPQTSTPAKASAPISSTESLSKHSQSPSQSSVITSITTRPGTDRKAPIIEISESDPPAAKLEYSLPMKSTDPIIAAREASPTPPVPVRSPSRKPSFRTFTERARFHLTRRKSPASDLGRDDTSSTNLPIQSPSSHDSPADRPSSPVVRRLSTRQANAVSMSTYSASPTSTSKPVESLSSRNMSPMPTSETADGKPSRSSYNSTSFLPLHPQLSPLPDYAVPGEGHLEKSADQLKRSASVKSSEPGSKRASIIDQQAPIRRSSSVTSNSAMKRSSVVGSGHPKRSSSINIPNSAPLPDDTGGSVNMQHPLLREARHTKFANMTMASTPARGSSRDLPLRHYHSQDNFHSTGFAGRAQEITLPKRISSLLYNPPPPTSLSAHPALSSAPLDSEDKLSPAPAQSSATPAPLKVESGPETARSVDEDSVTTSSSPGTAASEDSDEPDESEGATPPPIGFGVRSPSRLNTNIDLDGKKAAATTSPVKSAKSNKSPTSPSSNAINTTTSPQTTTETEPQKYKTSATNNIPFYLNPVSSAALIDFLASTPPPSPPHHHQRSTSDPNAFDSQNLYRNYRVEEGRSPAKPGPGGLPMLPLSLAQAAPPGARDGTQKKTAAWKRMFGARVGGGGKNAAKSTPIPKSEPVDNPKASKEKPGKAPKTQGKKDHKRGKDGSGNAMLGQILRNGSRVKVHRDTPGGEKDDEISVSDSTVTKDTNTTNGNVGGGGAGGGGGGTGHSFMGVGKDGMWISRKNFLRT
ncbi:MAG: hypothetical protein Q9183_001353 [Haloplaca sp. 2 TL-2023]